MSRGSPLLALLALLLVLPSPARGGNPDLEEGIDRRAPLQVTADQMVARQKKGIVEFNGSVVAVKGKLKVEGDRMVVTTDPDGGALKGIQAFDNVRITRGTKVATGRMARYVARRRLVIIEGDAVLIDGQDRATGESVRYSFDTEDMEILGGETGRSTLTIYPKEGQPEEPAEGAKPERQTFTLPATVNEPAREEELAPPPAAETPAPPKRRPEPQLKPGSKPKPAAAEPVPERSGYVTLQVAAFSDKDTSAKLIIKLKKKGYPVYLDPLAADGGKRLYRVRVGRFDDREAAEAMARRLKDEEGLDSFTALYEISRVAK